ncbi:NRDE family protein [Ferruginivarius sediminum]|uniref:NRDE family protein n=1 Tax=Ferruginivarius sediminum TaxID=2661937 RepID=A0A369T9W9_9PROT|nr:NRDE family protein [Ferruginivarius sediminum]RDD61175.1 hypothetical protein DRB17_13885 [Ferruginivarius sediminum]
MCTAVILRRPESAWPLIFAGNRDEMEDRPWRAPGRHWPDRPEVVAGMDELSGGSWLGVNDHGVMAAVLNRYGSLGPAPDKRSRGELVLEALDHAEARMAAEALADLEPAAYRSFNLIVADARAAFWIKNPGEDETNGSRGRGIEVHPIPEGLSMVTAFDLNDDRGPRIRRFLPDFRAAEAPDPARGDWKAWQALLARGDHDDGRFGNKGAMTFRTENGFATVSSALVALPAPPATLDEEPRPAEFLFAAGPPDRTPYRPVSG